MIMCDSCKREVLQSQERHRIHIKISSHKVAVVDLCTPCLNSLKAFEEAAISDWAKERGLDR